MEDTQPCIVASRVVNRVGSPSTPKDTSNRSRTAPPGTPFGCRKEQLLPAISRAPTPRAGPGRVVPCSAA
jgi:hypothetical protein